MGPMQTRRHYNGLKTILLFVGIIAVLAGVWWILSQSTGDLTWIVVFSLIGLVTTAISYWNSDKVAIRAMKAQPVSPNQARELRGVLAHELSHVANRDILTGSVAAALANVVTTAANVLAFGSLYGGRSVGRNPLAVIVAAFAAPLAAMVIRMAISRTREYDADADGALLTQDPLGLASALLKLEAAAQQLPMRPTLRLEPVSHLMIANPFGPLAGGQLFASHPPIEQRVERLHGMAVDLGQVPPA